MDVTNTHTKSSEQDTGPVTQGSPDDVKSVMSGKPTAAPEDTAAKEKAHRELIEKRDAIQGSINNLPYTAVSTLTDGYHSFNDLYDHRNSLFTLLCNVWHQLSWKSKRLSDGTEQRGWFIMGLRQTKGNQISYHLPIHYWDLANHVKELERAPDFDGHTADDVLKRLQNVQL